MAEAKSGIEQNRQKEEEKVTEKRERGKLRFEVEIRPLILYPTDLSVGFYVRDVGKFGN